MIHSAPRSQRRYVGASMRLAHAHAGEERRHRGHRERADDQPAARADLARHRPGRGLGALAEREAEVERLHDLRGREARAA
jgi:hypothetical protein